MNSVDFKFMVIQELENDSDKKKAAFSQITNRKIKLLRSG